MQVKTDTNGSKARIILDGRFDFSAHRVFRDAYGPGLQATDVKEFEIDLASVDYMDSSALGMLLMLREKAQAACKSVHLRNCQGSVRQILDVANFGQLFQMR